MAALKCHLSDEMYYISGEMYYIFISLQLLLLMQTYMLNTMKGKSVSNGCLVGMWMVLMLLGICGEAYAQSKEIEVLLARLDSVLANSDKYVVEKEGRIEELHKRQAQSLKLEDELWLNKMLYDEYVVYNADSAMVYVDSNIGIARRLGREDKRQEWILNKVYLLAAQGLLNEAEKELQHVDVDLLNGEALFQYYDTKIYLYSHLAQFIGSRWDLASSYYTMEKELQRKAERYIHPDHPLYYSFAASLHREYPRSAEGDSIKRKLKEIVDRSALSTRIDALNAYTLAVMYRNEGDEGSYMKYLICSAITDVKTCNRDIASLEELSNILYQRNDINRGYAYIGYCLKAALLYPNRVRVVNISVIMDKLQQAYRQKDETQQAQLRNLLYTTSILSVVLLLSVLFICFQFRKLSRSHKRLAESNHLLNSHVKELSETQGRLAEVNKELAEVNEKLKESNSRLFESNYVKEEYIGYVFSICSSYITKLEEYRKNIGRKVKAGQIDEIRTLTSGTSMVQNELKEFYHSFDAIFLHVYPDFVEDFNALLRPEERIVLKEGELLNTELRIYALVRLGINDSVKIAEFLHCSPQTVYNNRLRTRNKAVIPKEEFAETVRSLGKMQK